MPVEMRNIVHICVDVQSMFAADTDWHAPWLGKVLPAIEAIVARDPAHTIFTRFIPPIQPDQAPGAWRAYYQRWPKMTRAQLPEEMLEIVPLLRRYIPPATELNKTIYSPWLQTELHPGLTRQGVDTLIVTGGETDICVLATVMGAIDLGYRVILPTDAVFGSADQTHDAALTLYQSRFGQQLTACTTQDLLDNWADVA